MNKLDKYLIKNCITEHEMQRALLEQEKTNSRLTDILLSEGYINPYRLYSSIAQFNGVEFADLMKEPCNDAVISAEDREQYLRYNAIPWKKDGDKTIIATCEINDEVKHWAESKYTNFRFVITSPFDIHSAVNDSFSDANSYDAIDKLWQRDAKYSAKDLFKDKSSKLFLAIIAMLAPAAYFFPAHALTGLFLLTAVLYSGTLLFKTMLFVVGMKTQNNLSSEVLKVDDRKLPVYTILVPLYKETSVLKKLTEAIKAIDYPKSKLDVKLIVEADDELTIAAIKELHCERMFEMIKVPFSIPRTKPKACNYAMQFARGEFVTIYDAEDIPDPQQLKKALHVFYNSSPDVACVQAKLNFFNREENLLAKLFSIEYSNLFDFLLPGLEVLEVPIPLGGTSNHFRIKTLQELYGWDPYNVTEDADLGIRIAQKGWRSVTIESTTMEECPISLGAWIRQRSRWIKGHMQTYFVHMRSPIELYKKVGMRGFAGINFFMGAPALIFLISPFMWALWAGFMSGAIDVPAQTPDWFIYLINFSSGVLIAGIALQIFYAAVSIKKHKWNRMLLAATIYPFYWIAHSVSSFKSLWQLITKPYYWEKTNHGQSSHS